MASRSCVIFLAGPHTSQEFISQVLSQFDANLSADIPCCILTSAGEAPIWCGAESPGPADSEHSTWSTSLAGLKLDEKKLKEGSLDNVGITLHNLLDELPKYSVTHAVWISEQIPTAGASLILASGLMRFIKCHHGYLSIVSKCSDTHHSPWVKAMKAAVLPKSDVHKLAKIISKCCWVGDINFRGYQNSVDVTLTGVLVQGKHTDFVTNGNLTMLTVVQIVNTVPLYILKECVDINTFRTDTARRLATLTTKGLLCKVSYQKEQGIRLKSEWIRAVQTRSIGSNNSVIQGTHVLIWRGKLYTFRDVIQAPADQKGAFINHSPYTDWEQERRLLEFFEKAGCAESTNRNFPVKIPSPRAIPAAATVPTPMDILNVYEPGSYHSNAITTRQDMFDEKHVAKLSFRESLYLQTHGIQYYHQEEDDEKIQDLQRKYVHRETYSSLSLHNLEDTTTSKQTTTSKPTSKQRHLNSDTRLSRDTPSSKGKCRMSSLDRSKSLTSIPAATTPTLQRHARSSENVSESGSKSTRTCEEIKPSRSQRNKALLKAVIAECLGEEGVTPEDTNFRTLSSKIYDICKLLLRDAVSGTQGVRDTMVAVVKPQTVMVVMLEKQKKEG